MENEKKKITIKNEEKGNIGKLLNPVVKVKKESNLDEILKEIEEVQKEEEGASE